MSAHITDNEVSNWLMGTPDAQTLAHVKICSQCSAELQQLKKALGQYGETTRAAAERDEFACARERAIIIDKLHEPAPFRFGRLGLAAAMVLLAFAMLLMLRSPRPAQQAVKTPVPAVEQQDTDDTLLVEIQQDLQSDVPEALAPGLVLSAERNRLIAVTGSSAQ